MALIGDEARPGGARHTSVAPHVDAGLAGIGVHDGGAHSPDEWVDLTSMERQTKRAALFIHRLVQGSPAS